MESKPGKGPDREAFKLIEEMLELMESRGLVELEIEQQGLRIRLKKAGGPASVVEYVTAPPQAAAVPASHAAPSAKPAEPPSDITYIKSPMVGTFYRSPSPDASPFVEAGQTIENGQVVCIIEAMKLMNEIKAEVAGKIVEVLVQNGDPVEFGQPLFAVQTR